MSSTSNCVLIIRAVVALIQKLFIHLIFSSTTFLTFQGTISHNHGIPKVSESTVTKFENDHDLLMIDVLLNNITNGV